VKLVPTENLRFIDVVRGMQMQRVLQQWYAPDMPKYMRSAEGEWRDVPFVTVTDEEPAA
jgi:hypothetical protein